MKLIIAEKPSVARSIAKVLRVTEKKDGYLQSPEYLVSWCLGHLVELADAESYSPAYAKWTYGDLPILPTDWAYTVQRDRAEQLGVLNSLLSRESVDGVICATDAGREGELIFRLVYQHCGCQKPIQRLWISSMEDAAIEEGMRTLKSGEEYENLYQAALCRSKADWLVGINATRLFSILYNRTLNVGRVLSPTLAMVVQRESELLAFKPTPFYTVELALGGFTASGKKLGERRAAEELTAACDGGAACVQSVEQKTKNQRPPLLYDLTTLQREANRLLGFTAQHTLDCAQALYEKKLLTYPRTDSRYLTEDMADGLPGLVEHLAGALPFATGIDIPVTPSQVINSAKVSDHHALLPTRQVTPDAMASLPPDEFSVLTLVAVRLLCAVGDTCVSAETAVTVDCEGNAFTAKGVTILTPGWKALEQAYKATLKQKPDEKPEEKALPALTQGQTFERVRAAIKEGKTTPPNRYTEDTLLAAMVSAGQASTLDPAGSSECAGAEDMPEDVEKKGLGTPATRAGILEKLIHTGFVERKAAKKVTYFVPTHTGVSLITVLPEDIRSPSLTAQWEQKLKLVERGELGPEEFMKGIADQTQSLVRTYRAVDNAAVLFPSERPAVGTCPRCGGHVLEGKKGFTCEHRDCGFALWKDNRFFAAKKKELTTGTMTALLRDGQVLLKGCHSEKTGKSYDALVFLDDTGEKYVNFRMEFQTSPAPKKKG